MSYLEMAKKSLEAYRSGKELIGDGYRVGRLAVPSLLQQLDLIEAKGDRMGKKHKGPHRGALEKSAANREFYLSKRSIAPLALTDIVGTPRTVTIPVSQFKEIGIDERYYQRREQRSEVNSIIHAMAAGGIVPDPVKIAKRPDGSLWIVDGQQRYWAHVRMQRPMSAMIYEVTKIETEMDMFTIFNTRVAVNANTRVHAWTGEAAALLRQLNEKPDSPFFEQIDLGHNTDRPFGASILIKTISAVVCPSATAWGGGIDRCLQAVDGAFRANPTEALERASAVLHIIARVFDPKHQSRMRYLVAIAFALVCREKWNELGRIISPTPRQFATLSRYDWENCVEGFSAKYLPAIEEQILKRWR